MVNHGYAVGAACQTAFFIVKTFGAASQTAFLLYSQKKSGTKAAFTISKPTLNGCIFC